MLKIHVLGYWGTYPNPGEATAGYLIETDRKKVLLDCGSGVLAQMGQICSVNDLSAVVITHHHHDHTADLGVLGYAILLSRLMNERTQPLPMYMPAGRPDLTSDFEVEPMIELNLLNEKSVVNVGGMTIRFTRTEHPVFCLAVRIEYEDTVFAYSADSAFSNGLVEIARDADLFLCEASMYDGQEDTARQAGHLTAGQAGSLAQAAGSKRLVLTHYPHYGDLRWLKQQAEQQFSGPVEMVQMRKVLKV